MDGRFFSGSSLEMALLAAARFYGLEPERVAYQDRSKKQGLLRGGRRFVIEVDPGSPARAEATPPTPQPPAAPVQHETQLREARPPEMPAAREVQPREEPSARTPPADEARPAPPPRREREPAAIEGTPEEIESLHHAFEAVVDFLDVDVEWEIRRDREGVPIVDVRGEDSELLVDDDGQLLDAIEHLLPRLVRGWLGRGIPCKVDCNGFQARHEERLRKLALEAAGRVRATGKDETLAPLGPSDRRVIHMALAEDPDVATESLGNGFRKRVRVAPRRDR